MITFNPPDLKDRLAKEISRFREFMDFEWFPVDDEDFDPVDYEDIEITEESKIEDLKLPRSEIEFSVTVKEFFQWGEELHSGKLVDRREFRSPKRTLVFIRPDNELAHMVLGDVAALQQGTAQTINIGKETYTIRLVEGATLFGLKIAEEGTYEKWLPPCNEDDLFVEVTYPVEHQDTIQELVDSYLFELNTSLGLVFSRQAFPEAYDDWENLRQARVAGLGENIRIRPLMHGPGMKELLRLFNNASIAGGDDFAILGYTKVIEFVSATVIRQHSHEAIRMRLMSSEAIRPDARFIESLVELVKDQRVFQKDSEAIKLAIEHCCDAPLLAHAAPTFISELKSIRQGSKPEEKKRALQKLADCLSATRNQIVHAKTNFLPTGLECSEEQWPELVACARLAAQQVIRWFADVPESFRVLR